MQKAETKIPKGYRNTKQRQAILEILENLEIPIPAEDIYMKLKEKGMNISLSTVYRNLEMLMSEGIVVKSHMMNEDKARYGLSDKKHFLICESCGKILIIDNCPFDVFKKELMEVHQFDITGHSIEVYGICPECKTKNKKKISA